MQLALGTLFEMLSIYQFIYSDNNTLYSALNYYHITPRVCTTHLPSHHLTFSQATIVSHLIMAATSLFLNSQPYSLFSTYEPQGYLKI